MDTKRKFPAAVRDKSLEKLGELLLEWNSVACGIDWNLDALVQELPGIRRQEIADALLACGVVNAIVDETKDAGKKQISRSVHDRLESVLRPSR